ncbi:MAG: TolC family protein, partial [Planctomycetales bacterium]|nr:TolC family protein [Planctomycetales bacterium]
LMEYSFRLRQLAQGGFLEPWMESRFSLVCALTVAAVAVCLTAAPASAQQPLRPFAAAENLVQPPESVPAMLALNDLEQMALANNPSLAQAAARIEAAQGTWLQVGLKPNPIFGYSGQQIGDEGAAGQHGLYLQQEFVTAGKLDLNRNAAEQAVRREEMLYTAQQQRVLTDVRRNYYEALVAQRSVDVTSRLVEVSAKGVETADSLLKAGDVPRLDLLQARVQANSARILNVNARAQLDEAWRKLESVLGAHHLPMARLAGDPEAELPALEWDLALSRLYDESPEISAAYADLERARWQLEREIAGARQNFDIQAMGGANDATGDAFASLQFAMPIPVRNANQGAIARAQADLAAAEYNVDRLHLALRNRLAGAFRRYDAARRQYDLYHDQIVPDTQASLDIVRSGYPLEFNYLNLVTAQTEYFQAELGRLDSLRNLRGEAALIDGLLLDNSLDQAQ